MWAVVVLSCLALALGVVGEGLFGQLHSGEPRVPGAESQPGRDLLADPADSGEDVTLLVRDTDLTDEEVSAGLAAALIPIRQEIGRLDGVAGVIDPFLAPEGPSDPLVVSLVSTDRDGFLLIAELEPAWDDGGAARRAVEERLAEVPAELRDVAAEATGIVSSTDLIVSAATDQVQADLARGEAIALPLSLLVMVVVFGGFLAASMPLLGAIASIAGGMGVLLAFAHVIELDAAVVNVVTVLGLGLSIDYGLLVVSRYREEAAPLVASTASAGLPLRRRRNGRAVVDETVRRTVTTAGRTVTFSAVTIAIAISALMVFSPDILRSLGAAGVSVVVIALATALTLVGALLVVLGPRLQRPAVLARVPGLRRLHDRLGDVAPEEGVFSRLARTVHRRPWLVTVAVVVVLGVLVFQEGHLSGLLGFTPIGGLESYVVVIAFGFGLAMDYEVFLLARIKEYWDAGHDNDAAVEYGLQRSGRIITSAALIIVHVFLGFVAGELMVIKQVGFAWR